MCVTQTPPPLPPLHLHPPRRARHCHQHMPQGADPTNTQGVDCFSIVIFNCWQSPYYGHIQIFDWPITCITHNTSHTGPFSPSLPPLSMALVFLSIRMENSTHKRGHHLLNAKLNVPSCCTLSPFQPIFNIICLEKMHRCISSRGSN